MEFGRTHRLLQLVDRKQFDALCVKWQFDKASRSLFAWQQTEALVLAYVMRLSSLREIESVLNIPRSTLSDALANRPSGFFDDLCALVLSQIQQVSPDRKMRQAIRTVLAIDSSEARVHGTIGTRYAAWKPNDSSNPRASLKLHTVWNVNSQWIEDFRVTSSSRHDCPIARQFQLSPGVTYVFDRAYHDVSWWWRIIKAGSHFITRIKDCPSRRAHRERILRQSSTESGVRWDGLWAPTRYCLTLNTSVPKDFQLRRVIYVDPESKKVFDFVTSDFKATAQDIADTYRRRWAVELLFRWLKSNLNTRYFACRTPNSVRIQVAVAVLMQLLVQLHKISALLMSTPSQCLRQLRAELALQGLRNSGSQDPFSENPRPERIPKYDATNL